MKGIDSPKNLTSRILALKKAGVGWVGRYYFKNSNFKEVLTASEAKMLSAAGIFIVSVWENGFPTTPDYFTAAKGEADAHEAVACALAAHQPAGTVIYFAADCDVHPSLTVDYFQAVRDTLKELYGQYEAGIYGSGAVCAKLKALGLVEKTWLSMSKGWSGYDTGLFSTDIVQQTEGGFAGIDIDTDVTPHNSGGGWQI